MPRPLLIPVSWAFDPWQAARVAPGRVEAIFTAGRMRWAWASTTAALADDLNAWLALNLAGAGRIVGWSTAQVEEGVEVRGTVEFTADGQTWGITYGRVAAGNWRVRKVHRPTV